MPDELLDQEIFCLITTSGPWRLRLSTDGEGGIRLPSAIDAIADRWGEFTVTPATMLAMEQN